MLKIRKIVSSALKFSTDATKLSSRPFEEIPGPHSDPVHGTKLLYLNGHYDFHHLLESYQKMNREFGDLVHERVSPTRAIVHVFDPRDMVTVYESDGRYPRRNSHKAMGRYRASKPHLYSGPGLSSSNGEEWRQFRLMFDPAVLTGFGPITAAMEDVTAELVEALSENLDARHETEDAMQLLFRWGLETISRIGLDQRLGCLTLEGYGLATDLIAATQDTQEAILMTENLEEVDYDKYYASLVKAQGVIEKSVIKQLDSFLETEGWQQKKCIVAEMMRCPGADKKKVFTVFMDMYVAGIDSVSYVLGFMLYNIARNPEVQQKLREELRLHYPRPDSRFPGRIPYLNAVYDECLRINPVGIGNGRLLNKDLVLSGYEVPKDTMVILQHMAACRNEKYFKDADKFWPERWQQKLHPAGAYRAFGYGSRVCYGRTIARRQLLVAITQIVLNYELSYHHEPIGIRCQLLNVPDRPLRLRFDRIRR